MTKTMAPWILALVWAGALHAHHSGSMYDATPVWVEGTVVRFEAIDPHTITTVEARGADGQVRRWAVEGPGQFQLDRMGLRADVPTVGTVVRFCAFPYKTPAELARLFPGVDFSGRRSSVEADSSSPQYVAGHVMVTPDGNRRVWKGHGLISECIRRSDDQREAWLTFLNTNSAARQAWCEQRGYAPVQSNASLKAFVDEINGSIDTPCR